MYLAFFLPVSSYPLKMNSTSEHVHNMLDYKIVFYISVYFLHIGNITKVNQIRFLEQVLTPYLSLP